ncbi:uncharacterized protein DSM5745_09926 [Aspergillus mulundensis]|uniref:Uncharacterized protein n=1 Tax=Aspergillus mulundensis TaxID=1810919 RepID=A0A3D8QRT7_9EURO|nr:Uncharacterized protein DSM5745_09926 [Aspergillus mulundensis]RDW64515.1 Uncharacterized protein DSM5745_09926 [Aspergillus mulundensis]
MVLSHAKIMFRKLRGNAGGSRSSEPAPSAPATTAESEPVDPPRAIHISDVKRSPTKIPRKPGIEPQCITVMIANAKGAADCWHLWNLFSRETGCGWEFDPTLEDSGTDYLCDGFVYAVRFQPPPTGPYAITAILELMQHVFLVFSYDASSRESWDEMVTAYEKVRSRCDGVLPFLKTMIAAMGEGEGEGECAVSHAEAEAFATQNDCLFAKFSPGAGRGICDAVGSLVELAHGARGQFTMDKEGLPQREKRARAMQTLFPS